MACTFLLIEKETCGMIMPHLWKRLSARSRGYRDNSLATLAAGLWLGLYPQLHLGTYSTLTRDKWIIMFCLFFFTIVCILNDGIRHRLARPVLFPSVLAGCLIGWICLSCLLSKYNADFWWLGASVRKEGLLTQFCYILLFLCFSCAGVNLAPLYGCTAFGVLLFAMVIFAQRAGYNPFGLYPKGTSYANSPAFQGTIGNIDMGTGYLCLVSGFFFSSLSGIIAGRKRIPLFSPAKNDRFIFLSSLLGLLLSVCLILTMGVQFGIISLSAVLLFAVLEYVPPRYRISLILLLLILILLFAWFYPGKTGGLWELHEILHGRLRLSFGSNRLAVWWYSLGLAGESLLLGGGSDTFEPRFNAWLKQNGLMIPKEQDGLVLPDYFDNPHNEYLAQLINHGLPAMLLYIALLLTVLFHPRFRRSPFRLAVAAYAVQAFFSFSVCIVAPMFWVVLGLCCSVSDESAVISLVPGQT